MERKHNKTIVLIRFSLQKFRFFNYLRFLLVCENIFILKCNILLFIFSSRFRMTDGKMVLIAFPLDMTSQILARDMMKEGKL